MESAAANAAASAATGPGSAVGLRLRLLGPMAVEAGGVALSLPPSRKLRALVAYLALAPRPLARSHLCELLWDGPADPRGELRGSLSKARALLDAGGSVRLRTDGDLVSLDLADCHVDARALEAATAAGVGTLGPAQLRTLLAQCGGEFLDGLEIERSGPFSAWLVAQRRRLRAAEVALLEQWVDQLPPDGADALGALERWLALAPFDRRAHCQLLDALARRGQLREGDEHLAATARRFEADGQDWVPLARRWQAAKARGAVPAPAAADCADARPLLRSDALPLAAHPPRTGPPDAVADPRGTTPFGAAAAPRTAPSAAGTRLPGAAGSLVPSTSLALAPATGALTSDPTDATAPLRRASIAVMPFNELPPAAAARGGMADGLAHDVISGLARLRSLFVIAQGSVFALDERLVGAEDAARRLDVDYVAAGTLRRLGPRVEVDVQLIETRSARVLWADTLAAPLGDALGMLDAICHRIVASVAGQIELAERNRALLKPPASLDAWEAHHRGLWHVYRFNRADNALARRFFEQSLRLDPSFARPLAGLSFTHFQDAFLGWGERQHAVQLAYRAAADGLAADEHDPAAHWALGRALWLLGRVDDALAELASSVALSPNFALGHYTQAFVQAQSGDPLAAIAAADLARALSPFDPLLFAMLASRALALLRLGRLAEAADWAARAAARPNAHVHVLAIGAHCLALAGRQDEARRLGARIALAAPGYRVADTLDAFRLADDAAALFRRSAAAIGLG